MAKATHYVINGAEVVTTLKEVATVLGVDRVTGADIKNGKYPMVEVRFVDDTVDVGLDVSQDIEHKDEFATQEYNEEQQSMLEDMEQDTQELTNDEDEALTNTEDSDTDSEDDSDSEPEDSGIEFPEVGHFKDEKAMKKYIKKLTDRELQEWCELEGATWKPNDHESINRMRMAMAIKAIHFPDTAPKAGKKSKSKYADYTTEQLVAMALEADVEVPDDKGDMRICRMYTIMALRKAGILA